MTNDELRDWHLRIVAAHENREAMGSVDIRANGRIVGQRPCYLPAWMLSEERQQFLKAVDEMKAAISGDEAALLALHAVPGVPMRIPG